MKLLKELMRQQGIYVGGKAIYRNAVRGVIIKDRTLLMIYSTVDGDYKFPGGGVNKGETLKHALVREISEECGANVLSINRGIGKIVEYDRPKEEDYDVFKMVSFYYLCEVDPNFGEQSLDQYEKDLGFTPVWVDIDKAISANQRLLDSNNCPRWTKRELFVLKYIKEKFGL